MESEAKKFRIKDKSIKAEIYGYAKIEKSSEVSEVSELYSRLSSTLEILEDGEEYKKLDSSNFIAILHGKCTFHLDSRITIEGEFQNNNPISDLSFKFIEEPEKNFLIKFSKTGLMENSDSYSLSKADLDYSYKSRCIVRSNVFQAERHSFTGELLWQSLLHTNEVKIEYFWSDKKVTHYTGPVKFGYPHGNGTKTFQNGDTYSGEFRFDQKSGHGEYKFKKSGNVYLGNFCKNVIHGKGVMTYSDGRVYEGMFEKGFKQGYGILNNPKEGHIYKGNFFRGYFKNQGVLEKVGEYKLEGKWDKGKLEGKGVKRFNDGRVLEVHYVKGNPKGRFTLRKKGDYEVKGSFKIIEGVSYLNGEIIIEKENGDRITEFHREGIFTITEDNIFEQEEASVIFYKRKEVLNFTKKLRNLKKVYEGETSFGERNGFGTYYCQDGKIYEGNWEEGVLIGEAKLTMNDGSIVTGNWSSKGFPTEAIMTKPDGEKIPFGMVKGTKYYYETHFRRFGKAVYKDGSVYE